MINNCLTILGSVYKSKTALRDLQSEITLFFPAFSANPILISFSVSSENVFVLVFFGIFSTNLR